MNFIFDSCFFGTNNIYIQNNNTFILPERIPFNDVTEKMKSFFNIKKNQSFNSFSMNFNDIPKEGNDFQFLKKKSHGDIITNFKENEENLEPQESSNKSSKYLNIINKRRINNINNINYSLNNLDEDNDENDNKENIELMNNDSSKNKNDMIDMNQIVNDTIKEKKENDKFERERKKANKIRQMKMTIKNRKNMNDYINKKNEEKNKENICDNGCFNSMGLFEDTKKEKEINMMNID